MQSGARPDFQVLFDEDRIAVRLNAMAGEIAAALPREFLGVAILKGSFVFAADLIRAFHRHGSRPDVDFMTLSSYGASAQSSGTVTFLRDVEISVQGRTVLLIDDILDSGRTLAFAAAHLLDLGAARIAACVLLDKGRVARIEGVSSTFVGFSCPDQFVVGYGMDHAHRFRELPFVAMLDGLEGAV